MTGRGASSARETRAVSWVKVKCTKSLEQKTETRTRQVEADETMSEVSQQDSAAEVINQPLGIKCRQPGSRVRVRLQACFNQHESRRADSTGRRKIKHPQRLPLRYETPGQKAYIKRLEREERDKAANKLRNNMS